MSAITPNKSPETTTSNSAVAGSAPVAVETAASATQPAAPVASTLPRFHLAFESIKSKLREIPPSEFVPITIDVHGSVVTVLGALPNIANLRADIVEQLPKFDIKLLDYLETVAMALDYAQALYQTANEPLSSITQLVENARRWHGVLYNDACTLMARELFDEGSLNDLKGANGNKNLAQDTLALCALYRQHWARVSDVTTFSPEELDEAQVASEALSVAVGTREQHPEVTARAIRDRQAAFTAFTTTYDEICAAVAYVRRKQGDADTIAPSLYLGRTSKKKPADTADAKSPTPLAATPAANSEATDLGSTPNTEQRAPTEAKSDGPYMHN